MRFCTISQVKNRHFGGVFVLHVILAVMDEAIPRNCILYADLAVYWPFAVWSQVILSSFADWTEISCKQVHSDINSSTTRSVML